LLETLGRVHRIELYWQKRAGSYYFYVQTTAIIIGLKKQLPKPYQTISDPLISFIMEENWSTFHQRHHSSNYKASKNSVHGHLHSNNQPGNSSYSIRCMLNCILKPFSNPLSTSEKRTRRKQEKRRYDDSHLEIQSNSSSEFGYNFPSDELQVLPRSEEERTFVTEKVLE